jgi:release factor glutamine methyltransferase
MAEQHTIGSILSSSEAWLRRRGVDQPKLDVGVLLAHALDMPRLNLYMNADRPLRGDELDRFRPLLARRGAREPVSQIVGRKGFWALDFSVNKDVLTPRPETEMLIEHSFALQLPETARVIDLCTGSGCIAATLASERRDWQVVATELSEAAATVAQANLEALELSNRVELIRGDLFANCAGTFDLVVSNPPYIGETERQDLPPEVRDYEPGIALFSGRDGLDLIRRLVAETTERLNENGWLLIEHGCTQGEAIRHLFQAAGLRAVTTYPDLNQHDRITVGQKQATGS